MGELDGVADERLGQAHGRCCLNASLRARPQHCDAAADDQRDDIDQHKHDEQLRAHRPAVPQTA